MPRAGLLCSGLLSLAPHGAAWWPFGSSGPVSGPAEPEGPPVMEMGMMPPPFAFGGMPGVVVVESHFGSDPFEDLHRNLQQVIQQSHQQRPLLGGPEGSAVALPLEDRLGGILSAFGDHHAGHFGRSGKFEVDDDHVSRFRITAELPGYKIGDDNSAEGGSPLNVRAVGRRSLVVSGTQQMGPAMFSSWQRSFQLPKGSDINNISVTYNAASGNLTVDVPRTNSTEAEGEEEEEPMDEEDMMLPPVLRAMRSGMPQILGQLSGPGQPKNGGFLMPAPIVPDLGEILGMMGQMHPRFHPPSGGEKPIPEDAVVNLVGCFAESQLDKVQLKYYGDSNAASFNAMYWHARGDHVPYFAMSRHEDPIGHAFTAHGFVHESEKPQWGVYDGCGMRCADEEDRWCGCANEASRGLGNRACEKEGEKRFAVYKIGEAERTEEDETEGKEASPGAAERPVAMAQPYWQLSNSENGSSDGSIEIVVPKGTVAKAQGREVLLYNASETDAAADALAATAAPAGEGFAAAEGTAAPAAEEPAAAAGAAASSSRAPEAASSEAPSAAGQATAAPQAAAIPAAAQPAATASPVGKMRLPAAVSPEACSWEDAKTSKDGNKVIKCKLDKGTVKSVPIKVVDEL